MYISKPNGTPKLGCSTVESARCMPTLRTFCARGRFRIIAARFNSRAGNR